MLFPSFALFYEINRFSDNAGCIQKLGAKVLENGAIYSGIINLLLDGLTYNMADTLLVLVFSPRPFGARKNTTQLAKYPRVLYFKPSNKVYIYLELSKGT